MVLLVRGMGAMPLNHIRPLTTYLLSIKLVLFKAIILGYVTYNNKPSPTYIIIITSLITTLSQCYERALE